jgi:hypothetical protein
MSVTLAAICDAITAHLEDVPGLKAGQSYEELTEGMNTFPTIQVYPQSGSTDQLTFRQKSRIHTALIHVDLYAGQRSDLKGNMASLVAVLDALQTEYEKENEGAPFGVDGVQWAPLRWERVTFLLAGIEYIGARFYLDLRMY